MLGKIEGKRRRRQQKMRWIDSMDMNLTKLQEIVKDRGAWHVVVHGVAKIQTCDSPGKNTGVGCHAPLQGMFLTQGSNSCLLHRQAGSWVLYH